MIADGRFRLLGARASVGSVAATDSTLAVSSSALLAAAAPQDKVSLDLVGMPPTIACPTIFSSKSMLLKTSLTLVFHTGSLRVVPVVGGELIPHGVQLVGHSSIFDHKMSPTLVSAF